VKLALFLNERTTTAAPVAEEIAHLSAHKTRKGVRMRNDFYFIQSLFSSSHPVKSHFCFQGHQSLTAVPVMPLAFRTAMRCWQPKHA